MTLIWQILNAFACFLLNPKTHPYHSIHCLKAPHHPSLTLSPWSCPFLFPPPCNLLCFSFSRYWVDLHQKTHAGWHHHRLCLWPGLHAASRHSLPNSRLEKVTTGNISPWLLTYFLYMVPKNDTHCVVLLFLDLYKCTLCEAPLLLFLAFLFCPLYLSVCGQGASSISQVVVGQRQKRGGFCTTPQGSASKRPGITSLCTGVWKFPTINMFALTYCKN